MRRSREIGTGKGGLGFVLRVFVLWGLRRRERVAGFVLRVFVLRVLRRRGRGIGLPVLLEQAETAVGAGDLTVEGGLHAGETVEGIRGGETPGESLSEAQRVRRDVERIVGVDEAHFLFEQDALDVPEAVLAPEAVYDFFDEADLGLVGGLEAVEVLPAIGFEGILGLAVEDDDAGENAVLEAVPRGAGLAPRRFRTAGFGPVDAGLFGSG